MPVLSSHVARVPPCCSAPGSLGFAVASRSPNVCGQVSAPALAPDILCSFGFISEILDLCLFLKPQTPPTTTPELPDLVKPNPWPVLHLVIIKMCVEWVSKMLSLLDDSFLLGKKTYNFSDSWLWSRSNKSQR